MASTSACTNEPSECSGSKFITSTVAPSEYTTATESSISSSLLSGTDDGDGSSIQEQVELPKTYFECFIESHRNYISRRPALLSSEISQFLKEIQDRKDKEAERSLKEEKERYERLLKEKEKHELVNQIMRKKNESLRKTLHVKSRK